MWNFNVPMESTVHMPSFCRAKCGIDDIKYLGVKLTKIGSSEDLFNLNFKLLIIAAKNSVVKGGKLQLSQFGSVAVLKMETTPKILAFISNIDYRYTTKAIR